MIHGYIVYTLHIVCRLILLNKLLEDGNMLYRQGHLAEASHRYRYALKRLPPVSGAGEQLEQLASQQQQQQLASQQQQLASQQQQLASQLSTLSLHLLLNLSRCERRSGHYHEAARHAAQAIASHPACQEGYTARAKVSRTLLLS